MSAEDCIANLKIQEDFRSSDEFLKVAAGMKNYRAKDGRQIFDMVFYHKEHRILRLMGNAPCLNKHWFGGWKDILTVAIEVLNESK